MFRAAEIMIINKVDPLPYVEFNSAQAIANALEVNPEITALSLSARTGEGIAAWYDWLRQGVAAARTAMLV